MDTALEPRALAVLNDAKALRITTPPDYDLAVGFLRGVKALRQEIADTFDEPIAKAFAAHKATVAAKKRHDAPLDEAEGLVKRAMLAYKTEEDRKARELQAKLQAEARAQEEARRLEEAVQAEQAGQAAEAEALLEAPIEVPPVILPPPVPKVDGVSFRTTWNAELVNLAELIQAVAKGQAPMSLLIIDQTALREYARATKGGVVVPGVRFFTQQTVSAGSPTPTGASR